VAILKVDVQPHWKPVQLAENCREEMRIVECPSPAEQQLSGSQPSGAKNKYE